MYILDPHKCCRHLCGVLRYIALGPVSLRVSGAVHLVVAVLDTGRMFAPPGGAVPR